MPGSPEVLLNGSGSFWHCSGRGARHSRKGNRFLTANYPVGSTAQGLRGRAWDVCAHAGTLEADQASNGQRMKRE